MYPVYCFCVGNIVVQVPMGGDLKRSTTSLSTGDRIVVMLVVKKLDDGY